MSNVYFNYDFLFKFIVVGDSNVGKTSIIRSLTNKEFNKDESNTVGIDFAVHTFNIDNKAIKLQIWDTAGQEIFQSVSRIYYKNANGCLIVFDVSNRISFLNCQKWIENVSIENNSHILFIIVGNKTDKEREVTQEEAWFYANKQQIPYIETSAKDGKLCTEAFKIVTEKIYTRIKDNEFYKNFCIQRKKIQNSYNDYDKNPKCCIIS